MFWRCSACSLVSNPAVAAGIITAAKNSVDWILEGVNIVYIHSRQAVQAYHMITHGDYDEDKSILEIIILYFGSRVMF